MRATAAEFVPGGSSDSASWGHSLAAHTPDFVPGRLGGEGDEEEKAAAVQACVLGSLSADSPEFVPAFPPSNGVGGANGDGEEHLLDALTCVGQLEMHTVDPETFFTPLPSQRVPCGDADNFAGDAGDAADKIIDGGGGEGGEWGKECLAPGLRVIGRRLLWDVPGDQEALLRFSPGECLRSPPFSVAGVPELRLAYFPAGEEEDELGSCRSSVAVLCDEGAKLKFELFLNAKSSGRKAMMGRKFSCDFRQCAKSHAGGFVVGFEVYENLFYPGFI